ncbi:uncharacterized protein LOC135123675 isoform X2 [Zophobas morio]|uniref:uncharacterized protein LOC135123675 isoform X2 n=1 Tax=Zophobas morio TaxID=2755281 RepID=UPI0030834DD3
MANNLCIILFSIRRKAPSRNDLRKRFICRFCAKNHKGPMWIGHIHTLAKVDSLDSRAVDSTTPTSSESDIIHYRMKKTTATVV